MDHETLVTEQIDEGARIVDALRNDSITVNAAFWLRPSEDGHWYLYVVTPMVDDEGPAKAYRRLNSSLRKLSSTQWVDQFQIKLIGENDPISNDVRDVHHRYPGPMPIRFQGPRLGAISIDQAYIYPVTAATRP